MFKDRGEREKFFYILTLIFCLVAVVCFVISENIVGLVATSMAFIYSLLSELIGAIEDNTKTIKENKQ